MSREDRQLYVVQSLIEQYDGSEPLHLFLHRYFLQHKNAGSRDRKIIRNTLYAFYRTGNLFHDFSFDKKLALSLFLCAPPGDEFAKYVIHKFLPEEWLNALPTTTEHKWKNICSSFPGVNLNSLFPNYDSLSSAFKNPEFLQSHFLQPYLWLRVNNEYMTEVKNDLAQNNVSFESLGDVLIKLAPASSVTALISYKKGMFEIMDKSSFATTNFFEVKNNDTIWDVCCGAGGKTLALIDKLSRNKISDVSILCSDIRESILINLKKRIGKTQFRNFDTLCIDATHEVPHDIGTFDCIIVDAPCSGSGTWGRTPENLFYFDAKSLPDFKLRQISILSNSLGRLKANGILYYITCSVYGEENEQVIEHIAVHEGRKIIYTGYVKGYTHGADTMFVAVLQ